MVFATTIGISYAVARDIPVASVKGGGGVIRDVSDPGTILIVGAFSFLPNGGSGWFSDAGFAELIRLDDWREAPKIVQCRPISMTFIDWQMPHSGARNLLVALRESDLMRRTLPLVVMSRESFLDDTEREIARREGVEVIGNLLTREKLLEGIASARSASARRVFLRDALHEMIMKLDRGEPLGKEIEKALLGESSRWWKKIDERLIARKLVDRYHGLGFPRSRKSKRASAYEKAGEDLGVSDATVERWCLANSPASKEAVAPLDTNTPAIECAQRLADTTGEPVLSPVGWILPRKTSN